jgi:hypothetical protein
MAGQMLYLFGSGEKEELRSEALEQMKRFNSVFKLRTGGILSISHPVFGFISALFCSLLHYFIGS